MSGGPGTPELAAAVSNAGGLGSLAVAYQSPDEIVQQARALRALTSRPFAINLFAPVAAPPPPSNAAPMLEQLARYHAQLGLPPPVAPTASPLPDFEAQAEAVLACAPTVFSFTFGIPSARVLESFRARGVLLAGTATNVEEGRLLEAAGVDLIVAQGAEAGGHRGTFSGPFEGGVIGTMALVPQLVDAVRLPIIASGGIMDGRGIVAARWLGASGVQLGTAFMLCPEAGTSATHRAALRTASAGATRITRAFSGRPARGIVNDFSAALEGSEAVLPFPYQHGLTTPLRRAAARVGDARFLALWAGQGVTLVREGTAAERMRSLLDETASLLSGTPGSV
ncbi:nitronate monooxygenase [Myxococcaceae bacterium JPH2]|nr:nitronate monooxygenase [Myxococcaceae bacterium JPH2]